MWHIASSTLSGTFQHEETISSHVVANDYKMHPPSDSHGMTSSTTMEQPRRSLGFQDKLDLGIGDGSHSRHLELGQHEIRDEKRPCPCSCMVGINEINNRLGGYGIDH